MSIEEAEDILNEAVIEHPSVSSYTYISAEEIKRAINKMLEERIKDEKKIKELEENIIQERNQFKEIIIKQKLEKTQYPSQTHKNKNIYLRKVVKYIKKVVKPHFLLEN